MERKLKKTAILAATLFLAGCAAQTQSERLAKLGTVIPKPEGIFEAIGENKDEGMAMKIALASAEQTCLQRQKHYIVHNTKATQEETLVDEKVAKTADVASKISKLTGTWIPGGDFLRGKKQAKVTFTCE
jgi:hypothetical protein